MTYQQYYEELYQGYAQASQKFLELDKKLSETNGFGNFSDIPEYAQAKKNWQIATNNFWSFLSRSREMNVNPNDEMPLS